MTVTWRKVGSTLSSRGDKVKLTLKDLKNAPVQNSRLERRVFVVGFAVLWERKQAIYVTLRSYFQLENKYKRSKTVLLVSTLKFQKLSQ